MLRRDKDAFWFPTNMPGFENKGYWCVMRKRGHSTKFTDNKCNSNKYKRFSWVNRYEQMNNRKRKRYTHD